MSDVTSHIELEEGLRLTVYDDSTGLPIVKGSVVKGNPTIGYGTLLSAPGGIDTEEAHYLLGRRISRARAQAANLPCFNDLDPIRRSVLVEMVYQLGFKGVMGFKDMFACLVRKDYSGAKRAMLASTWATQTHARAQELADVMESGK